MIIYEYVKYKNITCIYLDGAYIKFGNGKLTLSEVKESVKSSGHAGSYTYKRLNDVNSKTITSGMRVGS